MDFSTEQEEFWAGEFGNEYVDRNNGDELIASNINLFTKALNSAEKIESVVEFGTNIGLNLEAMKILYPLQNQFAIEINKKAATLVGSKIGEENVFNGSIFDFQPNRPSMLSLIKGVLIHINPKMLPNVYDKLYQASNKYILICEYYNPAPVTISYRGHSDKLYKRDFAGDMLDRFENLKMVDYGFVYHRDNAFPQDDVNWFLLEKNKLPK